MSRLGRSLALPREADPIIKSDGIPVRLFAAKAAAACSRGRSPRKTARIRPSRESGDSSKRDIGCRDLYFARAKVRHSDVATFRQNVGELALGPALWRGATRTHFAPREVDHPGGGGTAVARFCLTKFQERGGTCLAQCLWAAASRARSRSRRSDTALENLSDTTSRLAF